MVLRAGQTISQIALHMGVAFSVMYALTGSMAFGGIAALVEPVCNVVLLPLHELRIREVLVKLCPQRLVGDLRVPDDRAGVCQRDFLSFAEPRRLLELQ